MFYRALAAAVFVGCAGSVALPDVALAATTDPCESAGGATHRVGTGEDISDVAERYYGEGSKWTIIYYANEGKLGNNPSNLEPGMRLSIPCLQAAESDESRDLLVPKSEAELNLLTGGNYEPFTTSAGTHRGGMVTEIVNAAFEEAPRPVTFSITWEDDWSKHISPGGDGLIQGGQFDAGFPWLKPNCDENPGHHRCDFHFSDELVEMLVRLYVRPDGDFVFEKDRDIYGKTVCRPKGYYTFDLKREGREWLQRDRIQLVRAESPEACFEKLVDGDVDGVTMNEFTSRTTIHDLGIGDSVRAVQRPISIQGLHLIVPKTHPRGTTFLYRFNAGLRALKQQERYDEIVKRHLARHWDSIEGRGEDVASASGKPDDGGGGKDETPDTEDRDGGDGSSKANGGASGDGRQSGAADDEPDTGDNRQAKLKKACQSLVQASKIATNQGDPAKVAKLSQLPAEIGIPHGQLLLGIHYYNGKGVDRDYGRAVELLTQAAKAGEAFAAYIMFQASYEGHGVEESMRDALLWLFIAEQLETENSDVREKVDSLIRDLRKNMDDGKIDKTRSAAARWMDNEMRENAPDCGRVAKKPEGGSSADVEEVEEDEPASSGSGFFVSSDGHVLTNQHVISDCRELKVRSLGKPVREAEILAARENVDLAILKPEEGEPDRVARFRSVGTISQGSEVLAYGFPLRGYLASSGTMTDGIVSALTGIQDNPLHYSITAALQPGNSGGPVVDQQGRVIGAAVGTVGEKAQEWFEDNVGTRVKDANFAIKASNARIFLKQNGIEPRSGEYDGKDVAAPEVLREISAQVLCYK